MSAPVQEDGVQRFVKKKKNSSKYDFVKVKIWVEPECAQHYVLSRFLLSRMLTVTCVPSDKAVKIALVVKKFLVDAGLLSIPQSALEAILFLTMARHGFGRVYVQRYRLTSAFFALRTPLIILLSGAPTSMKSTLAQALADALNIPNVQQSDVMYDLLCAGVVLPGAPPPLATAPPRPIPPPAAPFRTIPAAASPPRTIPPAPAPSGTLPPVTAAVPGAAQASEANKLDKQGSLTPREGGRVGSSPLRDGSSGMGSLPLRDAATRPDAVALEGAAAQDGGQPARDGQAAKTGVPPEQDAAGAACDESTGMGGHPLWERGYSSSVDQISAYQRECVAVRRALKGDISKALKDGKPLIIEGLHLDPGLYLAEAGVLSCSLPAGHPARTDSAASTPAVAASASDAASAPDALPSAPAASAIAAAADSAAASLADECPPAVVVSPQPWQSSRELQSDPVASNDMADSSGDAQPTAAVVDTDGAQPQQEAAAAAAAAAAAVGHGEAGAQGAAGDAMAGEPKSPSSARAQQLEAQGTAAAACDESSTALPPSPSASSARAQQMWARVRVLARRATLVRTRAVYDPAESQTPTSLSSTSPFRSSSPFSRARALDILVAQGSARALGGALSSRVFVMLSRNPLWPPQPAPRSPLSNSPRSATARDSASLRVASRAGMPTSPLAGSGIQPPSSPSETALSTAAQTQQRAPESPAAEASDLPALPSAAAALPAMTTPRLSSTSGAAYAFNAPRTSANAAADDAAASTPSTAAAGQAGGGVQDAKASPPLGSGAWSLQQQPRSILTRTPVSGNTRRQSEASAHNGDGSDEEYSGSPFAGPGGAFSGAVGGLAFGMAPSQDSVEQLTCEPLPAEVTAHLQAWYLPHQALHQALPGQVGGGKGAGGTVVVPTGGVSAVCASTGHVSTGAVEQLDAAAGDASSSASAAQSPFSQSWSGGVNVQPHGASYQGAGASVDGGTTLAAPTMPRVVLDGQVCDADSAIPASPRPPGEVSGSEDNAAGGDRRAVYASAFTTSAASAARGKQRDRSSAAAANTSRGAEGGGIARDPWAAVRGGTEGNQRDTTGAVGPESRRAGLESGAAGLGKARVPSTMQLSSATNSLPLSEGVVAITARDTHPMPGGAWDPSHASAENVSLAPTTPSPLSTVCSAFLEASAIATIRTASFPLPPLGTSQLAAQQQQQRGAQACADASVSSAEQASAGAEANARSTEAQSGTAPTPFTTTSSAAAAGSTGVAAGTGRVPRPPARAPVQPLPDLPSAAAAAMAAQARAQSESGAAQRETSSSATLVLPAGADALPAGDGATQGGGSETNSMGFEGVWSAVAELERAAEADGFACDARDWSTPFDHSCIEEERPPARSGTAPPDPRTDLRTCSPAGLRDYYTFARHVDQYLCSYSELGVPVYHAHLGNVSLVLAAMHDHILGCIQESMAACFADQGHLTGDGMQALSVL